MREGLFKKHACVIYQVFCGEIVGRVNYEIVRLDNLLYVLRCDIFFICNHFDIGVQCLYGGSGGLDLRDTEVVSRVYNLPLQICKIDAVGIDDTECADARGGKVHYRRGAETSGSYYEYLAVLDFALAFCADIF